MILYSVISCKNISVTNFVLLGLTNQEGYNEVLFLLFFLLYIITLSVNAFVMMIIILDANLHTPMYFFLGNLSFLDIFYSSVVVPKMLVDFLSYNRSISFSGCMLQIHFFHFLGSTEVVLFSVMSYDRYVAIGHPLRYSMIMSPKLCVLLVLNSWIIGFFHALLHMVMTAKVRFCENNLVEHFFCDIKPVLKLACEDISLNLKLLTRVTGTLATSTFLLTFLSYIFIGKVLINMRPSHGRKKALSTCSGHLLVVFFQYGTAIFTYIRPYTDASLDQDRAVAVLFTAITPTLNPIIYSIRNKDINTAIAKMLNISPIKCKRKNTAHTAIM
ncbi:olfactory receptor 12D2-like [Lithobates pipiens]